MSRPNTKLQQQQKEAIQAQVTASKPKLPSKAQRATKAVRSASGFTKPDGSPISSRALISIQSRPVIICSAVLVFGLTVYIMTRPRPVYLVDHTFTYANDELSSSASMWLSTASQQLPALSSASPSDSPDPQSSFLSRSSAFPPSALLRMAPPTSFCRTIQLLTSCSSKWVPMAKPGSCRQVLHGRASRS
ncbi:hypothetical protein TB2_045512 [Malus domestica]